MESAFPAPDEPLYLQGLNPAQRAAVAATEGPVLVLAGAGTGKTRVLAARLVHLLATSKAVPGQIFAVTFTNKAAGEMRERVSTMLGRSVEGWHLGTFHSLAARLLRPHAERVGLRPNFIILDQDDQLRLIKQILEAENIDDKKSPARLVHAVISRWKDRGLGPEDVKGDGGHLAGGKLPKIYAQYQERLATLNACDFGDLLMHHLRLLRENPDILAALHERFRYILVDEYQDTNVAQYLWLRLLAQAHKNICCVGDEDQSIYGWRGAEIGNILRFEEDFPGAEVIRLEQNYRSTGHILAAASHLIAKNRQRLGKTLWTSAEPGTRVRVQTLWDGEEEARWVADEIETLQRAGTALSGIAVMVRAGFQTRHFEERFIQLGIPYRVLVGARFYERAEIRDAMAYLRLLQAPEDDLAFERIVNTPKRGVGPAALQQLHLFARTQQTSLNEAAALLSATGEMKPKLRESMRNLTASLARWRELLKTLPHPEVAQIVLDESGYTGMLQADKSPEAPGRLDNLKELVSALAEFDTLPAFLEHVSLVLEATEKSAGDQVSLMTLHGAKGLEFDIVFLPGWEEEIFPSRLSLSENGAQGLEEERRLAYVGLTRAKIRAFISHAANRLLHGSWINPLPSRFIGELPPAHIERQSSIGNAASAGGGWRGGHGDTHERKGRIPSIFQQINAGRVRTSPPPLVGGVRVGGATLDVRLRDKDNAQGMLNAPPPILPHKGGGTLPRQRSSDSSYENTPEFGVGARVTHEKFGAGTVRRIEHDKLEIEFDNSGFKKVMAGFVKRAG